LQHQGSVEALIQGAAKGVFERGERLGINKAVRNAVGEVKKNMQSLQSQNPPLARRISDVTRWSLDEGRAVSLARKTVDSMEQRNKQLSFMLGEALNDLRKHSVAGKDGTPLPPDAIDFAIAKVQFIQVYLEDSSMPLPPQSPKNSAPLESTPVSQNQPDRSPAPQVPSKTAETKGLSSQNGSHLDVAAPTDELKSPKVSNELASLADTPVSAPPQTSTRSDTGSLAVAERPRAPIPTRSKLAQSSFAFMLEPDASSTSTSKSSSSKGSAPFLASGRRPLSGSITSREKSKAFLFGDEMEESQEAPTKQAVQNGTEEDISLGRIWGTKRG
jgi:TBC1 domain family protein 5